MSQDDEVFQTGPLAQAGLVHELQKFTLKAGDILVVRGLPDPTFIANLIAAGKVAGVDAEVPILILEKDVALELIDEAGMREAGWMKIPLAAD
jgi:hypothetical protein